MGYTSLYVQLSYSVTDRCKKAMQYYTSVQVLVAAIHRHH